MKKDWIFSSVDFLQVEPPLWIRSGSNQKRQLRIRNTAFYDPSNNNNIFGVIEPGARTNSEPGPGSCRIQCQSVVFLVPGGEPQPGGPGLPGGEWRW